MIKLLDCTLRDGGYINNWQFGQTAIHDIKNKLEQSGVDIIELGFLRDDAPNADRTVFNSIDTVKKLIGQKQAGKLYAVMAEVSNPFPLEKLAPYDENSPEVIRVIVWKRMLQEGFEYCKGIVEKGYKLCVQPARVSQYSDDEFVDMIKKFNELNPMAIYVVDSWGTMYKEELLHYLKLADENLKDGISVGYHGHNNLMQAMDVAQAFCEFDLKRDLIIDASIYGIGRGAGNLNTELFAMWANKYLNKSYDLSALMSIYDMYIKQIYDTGEKWGYSIPYFITAKYNANPNFASFYAKQGLSNCDIEKSIAAIPPEKRIIFKPETAKEYAVAPIYDKKLAVIIPTKNRPSSIIGFLNDYASAYHKNAIDVIIYDSSDNNLTEQIIQKYNKKYPNIKYAKYTNETDLTSLDKKYISIIETYADQYKYLWIARDGSTINIAEVFPQVAPYLDNNYELIVLDNFQRDMLKTGSKTYTQITELFKDNIFQLSVLGSAIVRSDVLNKMVQKIPLDDKKNYGWYWPIAYFDCFANSEIKAVKLVLSLWHDNYGVLSFSFWHRNFLWQFGERWYNSIMALPDVYASYKQNAVRFQLADCKPFSLLFILNAKKNVGLRISDFMKHKTYIQKVSDIPSYQLFLIFFLPYLLLKPIHKRLRKKKQTTRALFNQNLVENFLNDNLEEKDILLMNNKIF